MAIATLLLKRVSNGLFLNQKYRNKKIVASLLLVARPGAPIPQIADDSLQFAKSSLAGPLNETRITGQCTKKSQSKWTT